MLYNSQQVKWTKTLNKTNALKPLTNQKLKVKKQIFGDTLRCSWGCSWGLSCRWHCMLLAVGIVYVGWAEANREHGRKPWWLVKCMKMAASAFVMDWRENSWCKGRSTRTRGIQLRGRSPSAANPGILSLNLRAHTPPATTAGSHLHS